MFKTNRKLIRSNESKISILQIIGFILMLIGIGSLIISVFCETNNKTPSIIAVSFFITMIGFSLAFPSLLEGNEGLSTMRIIVFMVTNVICMLLLKIGWGNNVSSLLDIKLDQYWMGVIAFVFGAKATQSFFESKMAANKTPASGMAGVEFSGAEIAKLAIAQNEQYLKVKYPNILSISDAVGDLDAEQTHVVALYLKDNNTPGIPGALEAKMPDGSIKNVATEVIGGMGTPKIHISQKDRIETEDHIETGSLCCLINSSDDGNFTGFVTAGHVYSRGNNTSAGGMLPGQNRKPVLVNGVKKGSWLYQSISATEDLAIVQLDDKNEDSNLKSFAAAGYDIIDDTDVKKCAVTLISNKSADRTGFVLDYAIGLDIPYDNGNKYISGIILVGSTNDRNTSKTLSQDGDSGGCVYNSSTGQLIGMILGGDAKFTYVLAIKDTLDGYNYTLI